MWRVRKWAREALKPQFLKSEKIFEFCEKYKKSVMDKKAAESLENPVRKKTFFSEETRHGKAGESGALRATAPALTGRLTQMK